MTDTPALTQLFLLNAIFDEDNQPEGWDYEIVTEQNGEYINADGEEAVCGLIVEATSESDLVQKTRLLTPDDIPEDHIDTLSV